MSAKWRPSSSFATRSPLRGIDGETALQVKAKM
jgi:hypothetical protein